MHYNIFPVGKYNMEGHLNFKFQLNIELKILCPTLFLGCHHQVSMCYEIHNNITKLIGEYL